jgi:hypothetical protein
MCAHCQIEPKIQIMYSTHSSSVERQLSIRGGGAIQVQANTIYLNLGFLHENAGL